MPDGIKKKKRKEFPTQVGLKHTKSKQRNKQKMLLKSKDGCSKDII